MLFLLAQDRVLSAEISIPWRGCWVADLVLDPELPKDPSGKLPLVLGDNAPMLGTIDEDHSGSFAGTHKARLVGGLGWRKELPPQHFYNPAQLLAPAVILPTAAAAGEVAVVAAPFPMGDDGNYVRHAGAASRVLDGLDWHVELVGTTTVGPRIPRPLNPLDVELLHYDPATKIAELGGTTVVEPGALIAPDPLRGLDEVLTVRHVSISVGPGGFRTFVKCGEAPTEPGNLLAVKLRQLVREVCKNEYTRLVRCRVVSPGPKPDTYLLQAVELGEKADLVPAKVWPGMSGLASKLLPSSIVLVAFGSGQDAMVVGFDDSLPLELSLDALTKITIGGEGAMPLVLAPGLQAAVDAAAVAAGAIVGPVGGPALQTILQGISTALAASQTLKTKAI